MAKSQLAKQSFWTDEKTLELSDSCLLFFVALKSLCDKGGGHSLNYRLLSAKLGGRWHQGKIKSFIVCLEKSHQLSINSASTPHQLCINSVQKPIVSKDLTNSQVLVRYPQSTQSVPALVKKRPTSVKTKTNVYVKFTSHKEMFANLSSNTQNRYLELYPDQEFLERASLKAWGYYHDTNPKKEPSTVGGWTRALSSWLEKDWVKHVAQIKGLTAPAKMDIKKILADMGETIDED